MPVDAGAGEPSREQVEQTPGWLLIEFGASWCGHCKAARPVVQGLLQENRLTHLWVEDGKGRPLGRSFAVKLWPTLVLLRDGQEVARAVRPVQTEDLAALQAALGA